MNLGSYHPGRYYLATFSGAHYDFSLYDRSRAGVGRDDYLSIRGLKMIDGSDAIRPQLGGAQRTLRLISGLHEAAHYVHDLWLGSCLVADNLRDQSLGILYECLHGRFGQMKIRCPYIKGSLQSSTPELDRWLGQARDFYETGTDLIGSDGREGNTRPPAKTYKFGDLIAPTSIELIEGLVATQTSKAFYHRCQGDDDIRYLSLFRNELPILPENLPKLYMTARNIFDEYLGKGLGLGDYKQDEWPLGYLGSKRSIGDKCFMDLAQIALHIPPIWIMEDRIKRGQNTPLDFTPSYRYVAAIGAIARQGGFPDEDDPTLPIDQRNDNLFRKIFNCIANDSELRWPTYEETSDAWIQTVQHEKSFDRANASSGFKFRMIVERDMKPGGVLTNDPFDVCLELGIPIYLQTPIRFKQIQPSGKLPSVDGRPHYLVGQVDWPDMMPHELLSMEQGYWINSGGEPGAWEIVQRGYLQEIINRTIARELQEAIFYEDSFSCPFAGSGCSAAAPQCKQLRKLSDAPMQGCAVRAFFSQKAIPLEALSWEA